MKNIKISKLDKLSLLLKNLRQQYDNIDEVSDIVHDVSYTIDEVVSTLEDIKTELDYAIDEVQEDFNKAQARATAKAKSKKA